MQHSPPTPAMCDPLACSCGNRSGPQWGLRTRFSYLPLLSGTFWASYDALGTARPCTMQIKLSSSMKPMATSQPRRSDAQCSERDEHALEGPAPLGTPVPCQCTNCLSFLRRPPSGQREAQPSLGECCSSAVGG